MKIGKKIKTVTAPKREIRKVQPKEEPAYPVRFPYYPNPYILDPDKVRITTVTGV